MQPEAVWFREEGVTGVCARLSRHLTHWWLLFPCFVLKPWHRRTVNCSYAHSYRVVIVFCQNTRFRFQR